MAGGSRPTLWGRSAPPSIAWRPLVPCYITDPPQVQKTHSQALSIVDSKSVHMIKG
jgi:hypothetical protein